MRGLVVIAVLIGAVAGYRSSSYLSQQSYAASAKDTTVEPAKDTVPTSDASAITTISSMPSTVVLSSTMQPTAETPSKDEPPLEEITSSLSTVSSLLPDEELLKRRIITYDQRQEGQYNIRADLENFMIVFIPPNPSEGLSLLDFLTKSSLRRSSHTAKSKRKHALNAEQTAASKYHQLLKSGNRNHNINYLSRKAMGADSNGAHGYALAPQHIQPVAIVESPLPRDQTEFIEGRTPYHVDISANDEEQSRLHPDRPVDVLPPPYPLAYQHLIKPFHLEAEPTVIQALPPPEVKPTHTSGNFLETYNHLLASGLQNNVESSGGLQVPSDTGYYRLSRAIRGDNYIDSNRVTSSNSLINQNTARHSHVPIYRSDYSLGAVNFYPPIDTPNIASYLTVNANPRNFELSTDDEQEQSLEDSHFGEIIMPPKGFGDDDLFLDAQRIGFIDSDAKALLSDGMERCGPGRRRNSYGVCREIEGY